MIALAMLFNKVTGLYGLLAILTGYTLNGIQLSMYIYSVGTLVLLAILFPHIRKQSPLQCLALAWLYIVDTLVNTVYTSVFASNWYLSASRGKGPASASATAVASPIVSAGFGPSSTTLPPESTAVVDPLATPSSIVAAAATTTTAMASVGVGTAPDGAVSLALVIAFSVIRVYFCLIVASYARAVLTRHMKSKRGGWTGEEAADAEAEVEAEASGSGSGRKKPTSSGHHRQRQHHHHAYDEPFAVGSPEGEGWRGKAGRFLASIGRSYWIGSDTSAVKHEDEWMGAVNAKFKMSRGSNATTGDEE